MPFKGAFRTIILLPLLAPSLLPALGLIYILGTQGIAKGLLFGGQLYGPNGIVIASVFYALPHAVLIMSSGLAQSDARLYEAARALKAGPWRQFWQITLPFSRYSVISAASVCFVLIFTDFGIPTVVGGSTNVLATDIYKLVIGRFDFELGAVVGVLLLLPAIAAYGIDVVARRAQRATITGKSVPVTPGTSPMRDITLTVFTALVCLAILFVVGMAVFGSLVKFWPYNLSLDLKNYTRVFGDGDDGRALIASLWLAGATAMLGAIAVAVTGWLVARRIGDGLPRQMVQALAMLPVAVPGLVYWASATSLFQCAGESAQCFLRHADHHGGLYHRALLYGAAPDGGGHPAARRSRDRSCRPRLAIVSGWNGTPHPLADAAADDDRCLRLFLRQCHDHGLGTDLPVHRQLARRGHRRRQSA